MVGLSLGGGVDFRAGKNMRVRLETVFDQYGSLRFRGNASFTDVSGPNSASASVSVSGTARSSTTTKAFLPQPATRGASCARCRTSQLVPGNPKNARARGTTNLP